MAGDEDSHRDKEMAGYIFLRRRAEIHTTSSFGGNSFQTGCVEDTTADSIRTDGNIW